MKITGFLLSFFLLLLIWSCKSDPQDPPKHLVIAKPQLSLTASEKNLRDSLKQLILTKSEESGCPGFALCIIYKGEEFLSLTQGLKNRNVKYDSINSESLFRLGSLSKGFAGILAAKLINEGKFNLTDPVVKYIPDFNLKAKPQKDTIRIWHLLSHSSGLTEHAFTNLIENGVDKKIILKYINKTHVRDSTGKRYAYQNVAFSFIEDIIQNTTGLTYAQALSQYLLYPLKMKNTTLGFDSMMINPNITSPHRFNGSANGYVPLNITDSYYNSESAGGMNSNLSDMTKWLKALINLSDSVISNETKDIAFRKRISTTWDDKYYNSWPEVDSSFYGLGWRIIQQGDYKFYYHGGQVNSYRCELAFDPKSQFGIVALFNSPCHFTNEIVPLVIQKLKKQTNKNN